jgi:hypothetical protein
VRSSAFAVRTAVTSDATTVPTAAATTDGASVCTSEPPNAAVTLMRQLDIGRACERTVCAAFSLPTVYKNCCAIIISMTAESVF